MMFQIVGVVSTLLLLCPGAAAQQRESETMGDRDEFIGRRISDLDRVVREATRFGSKEAARQHGRSLNKEEQQYAAMIIAYGLGTDFYRAELSEIADTRARSATAFAAYLATPPSEAAKYLRDDLAVKSAVFLLALRDVRALNASNGANHESNVRKERAYLNARSRWETDDASFEKKKLKYERDLLRYEARAARLEKRRFDVTIPGDDYKGVRVVHDLHNGDSIRLLSASGRVGFAGRKRVTGPYIAFGPRPFYKHGGAFFYEEGTRHPWRFADWGPADWFPCNGSAIWAAAFDKQCFPDNNKHHANNTGSFNAVFEVRCPHREHGFFQGVARPVFTAAAPVQPAHPRYDRITDTTSARGAMGKSVPGVVFRIQDHAIGEHCRKLASGFCRLRRFETYRTLPADPPGPPVHGDASRHAADVTVGSIGWWGSAARRTPSRLSRTTRGTSGGGTIGSAAWWSDQQRAASRLSSRAPAKSGTGVEKEKRHD